MDYEKITDKLNPEQSQAVQSLDGPLLILAGAGSGKTRVLTQRTALLIATGKAAPNEILAVTFTNKAAKEMEARIFRSLSEIGYPVREPLWISTFHSFCTRILRSHIELLDYKPFFSIYDDSDQLSQIKKVMSSLNINDKTTPPKSFRNRINTAKMLGLAPNEVEKSNKLFLDQKSIEVYKLYEQEMKKANALDFGDLLMKVFDLFRMYPGVLEGYQDQFKYIMVDEYQDTNHIQYLLVQMLASKHRNLCVVGDEDQSIYSWRGADIRNIMDFEKDFPEAKVVKLEENYRSTQNIVNAATAVVKNNQQRKDKTLFTNNASGEQIRVREERSEYDEARFIARSINAMIADGEGTLADYAVFYRTNAQSRVLEEQFRTNSIPYQIIGGVRFYERMEIKDVLCYLKLSINPADDMAFKRIVNVPARGIGKTTVDRLEEISIQNKLSMLSTVEKAVLEREFNAGTTSKLRNFLTLVQDLQSHCKAYNLLEFYQLVLEKTDYLAKLKAEQSVEADARIENLEELSNAMDQFMKEREDASLLNFLEEMALVSDVDSMDNDVAGVTMMTLHVSKGLEYPFVFIVGLEENLFPSAMSAEDDEDTEIEEERRLCYVGMTRAREKLFLTYARSRKVWGQEQFNPPSRFLKEIPNELVQFTTSMETPKFMSRLQGSGNYAGSNFVSRHTGGRNTMSNDVFPDYESSENPNDSFSKGMNVRHPTFGFGSVFEVEGSGEQQKITVLFADQTIKKFVAKYARLEKA
jgi:DNA helicase-2/ATP-dependent DNA helicase PcrA